MPEFFARLQGDVRNDPTKYHHARLLTLSMKSIQEMVEKLVQARGLPAIQSSSWTVVRNALSDLAKGLDKYCQYLVSTGERINAMYHQMEPSRTPASGDHSAVERRKASVRSARLAQRYAAVERVLEKSEPYEYVVSLNEILPEQVAALRFCTLNCTCHFLSSCIPIKVAMLILFSGYGVHHPTLQTVSRSKQVVLQTS